jgi:hypothetical protein
MSNNLICGICGRECDIDCQALVKLTKIYSRTREKERHQLIRKLQKELNLLDAEPSKKLKRLAEQIIDRFPQLHFIRDYEIKIGYVLSQERPPMSDGKVKFADCEKVKLKYKAWLPYDFVITFYEPNIEILSENQKKILMLHELRHVGVGPRGLKINEHEVEDFISILEEYGIKWNIIDNEVPDILEVNSDG